MKFTVNWLKQYVDFDFSATELADRLTMLGLEVDAVEVLYQGLEQIKVGKVVSAVKHPNADKLTLCEVQVGDDLKRVVCGAANVRVGMLAPIALAGCQMPSGLLIKRSKIRGEVSEGMLCSGSELGLGQENSGLMELSPDCPCGASLVDALQLIDTMIEVDITPNRVDCTSLIGLAREVAGVTGNPLKGNGTAISLPATSAHVPVEIVDTDDCPRYSARRLRNISVGPSPWWLKQRLLAVGVRPINNVVDITNFVMLEYGQPLHAFDFAKIKGGKVVVRQAGAGETITTLDGVSRPLGTQTLVICDAERPVAIAGVMGGQNSEVSGHTTEVLLESAYFKPASIRLTSRALKLSTEASYRFERGIDPQGTLPALERATQLLIDHCAAILVDDGIDCYPAPIVVAPIKLRVSVTCARLGVVLAQDEVAALLARIEIPCQTLDADTLLATVPSFRGDLTREIDLIEEVARIKGYDELPSSLPLVPMSLAQEVPSFALRRKLAQTMVALGAFEAINYSFSAERYVSMLGLPPEDDCHKHVKIVNPLSDDQGVMRTTLLPGLLENVKHNSNRQTSDIALFEIGKVFFASANAEPAREALRMGAVFSGRLGLAAPRFHYGDRVVDLYDVKGIVEVVLSQLGLGTGCCVRGGGQPPAYADHDAWLSMRLADREVGCLGKLAQPTIKRFGLKQEVYYIEMDLDSLLNIAPEKHKFTPLSKFPSVSWDLAVVVPDESESGALLEAITSGEFPLVVRAQIFDIYRGQPVAQGYKSVALSITYLSYEKTLDEATVGPVHQRIIDLICTRFHGQLRDA